MLSFTPDIETEKDLVRFQGRLIETWHSISALSEKELVYLHRQALVSTIGASTRIENAVLTDEEIDWVDTTLSQDSRTTSFDAQKGFILDKLSKDRQRSIEEVAGCREVLTTIYQQAAELFPFTETHLRGLHHDLLRYYPQASRYAGCYKTTINKVVSFNHETGQRLTVLNPADPGIITTTAMADLINWYTASIRGSVWPVLVAVEFVFRFLAIHPFQDGNGRLGRGLFLLALLQSDDKYLCRIVPYLAIDRQIEKNKALYYKVLHQASKGEFFQDYKRYHYNSLARFFIRIMENGLQDIVVYRTRYANLQKLSESARRVLDCFKSSPEKLLKVSDIERQTALPRRTIQYNLKKMKDMDFLQHLGSGAGSRYQLIF
ncbi:MAG: Fic family protein [Thermodesulfobacteriota bacterium]|nr:Fic family protein [Thermodesulfobacteriota bacterium]